MIHLDALNDDISGFQIVPVEKIGGELLQMLFKKCTGIEDCSLDNLLSKYCVQFSIFDWDDNPCGLKFGVHAEIIEGSQKWYAGGEHYLNAILRAVIKKEMGHSVLLPVCQGVNV